MSQVLSFILCLVYFALAAVPSTGFATSFAPRAFSALLDEASLVVSGTTGEGITNWGEARQGGRRIYTYYPLQIKELIKGELPQDSKQIQIRQAGGEKDGLSYEITGSAKFEPGEEVLVLLLQQNSDSSFDIANLMLGKLKININIAGIEILEGPAFTLSRETPWKLEQLREYIKKSQPKNLRPETLSRQAQASPLSAQKVNNLRTDKPLSQTTPNREIRSPSNEKKIYKSNSLENQPNLQANPQSYQKQRLILLLAGSLLGFILFLIFLKLK